MSQAENRVDLPVFRYYGIALGLDLDTVQALGLSERVQLSQMTDVGFFEEEVLDVGESVLELVQNRRDSVEVYVIELHVVYLARFCQVPLSVDETQCALAVNVQTLSDDLHQVIASYKIRKIVSTSRSNDF